jgi:uncharacterized protein YjbI with pentapeptide repeats
MLLQLFSDRWGAGDAARDRPVELLNCDATAVAALVDYANTGVGPGRPRPCGAGFLNPLRVQVIGVTAGLLRLRCATRSPPGPQAAVLVPPQPEGGLDCQVRRLIRQALLLRGSRHRGGSISCGARQALLAAAVYLGFSRLLPVATIDPAEGLTNEVLANMVARSMPLELQQANLACKYIGREGQHLRQEEYLNLSGAQMDGAVLTAATIQNVDLRKAELRGANFALATIEAVAFYQADLTGARFDGATIITGLAGAILEGASFVGAIFECFETRLETESVLGRSVAEIRVNRILGNANGLRTCCFARAIFRGNDLSNVNLAGADLSGADFSDADLSGECTPLTQNVNIFNEN